MCTNGSRSDLLVGVTLTEPQRILNSARLRPGGYFHMYAYWVCAVRETPIFSAKFLFRSIYHFHKWQKNPVPSITILHFFAVPETIIFKISLISTRSLPPTGRLSPGLAKCQPDASWQFWRPAFSRSKRLKLGPEPRSFTLKNGSNSVWSPRIFTLDRGARSGARAHFFTLLRHIPTKIWGEYPPPGVRPRNNC